MLNAICWGITTTVLTALTAFIVLLATPHSVLSEFLSVSLNGPTLSQDSALFQSWQSTLGTEDAIITTLSLIAGGFTIGLLAPSRYSLTGRAIAAAKAFSFVILAWVVFVVVADLVHMHNKIPRYLISTQYILTELGCFVGWIAASAAGGALGAWVRSMRQGTSQIGSKTQSVSSTAS